MQHYTYSLNVNKSNGAKTWIFRYRDNNGDWAAKWLSAAKYSEIEAEAEFNRFFWDYRQGKQPELKKKATITVRLVAEKWLKLRYADKDTKPNTYKGLSQSVNNWILDNPKFNHFSVEKLNPETDLTVSVLREWIDSLEGEYSTRLAHITDFSSMLRDAIGEGWLSEEMSNPFEKPAVKRIIKGLRKAKMANHEIVVLSLEELFGLLTYPSRKIQDYRRIRYMVAFATGARDAEIQGLTFGDINWQEGYLSIERQLDYPGIQPFKRYDELVKLKLSKEEIAAVKNAVMANPKKDSKRIVPLHPALRTVLEYWQQTGWKQMVGRLPEDSDPLFPRGHHSPKEGSKPDSFCFCDSPELLKADLNRAEMPNQKATFQSIRRSFATYLYNNGVSESVIGKLLGHGKKSVTTAHYAKSEVEMLSEAVRRLPLPNYLQLTHTQITLSVG